MSGKGDPSGGRGGKGDKGKQPARKDRLTSRPVTCGMCGQEGHFPVDCPNVQCHQCKGFGHLAIDCTILVCRYCGKEGHYKRDCPKLVRRQSAEESNRGAARTPVSSEDSAPSTSGGGVAHTPMSGASTARTGRSVASRPVSNPAVGDRSFAQAITGRDFRPLSVRERVDRALHDLGVRDLVSQGHFEDRLEEIEGRREWMAAEHEKRVRELEEGHARSMLELDAERDRLVRDREEAQRYREAFKRLLEVHESEDSPSKRARTEVSATQVSGANETSVVDTVVGSTSSVTVGNTPTTSETVVKVSAIPAATVTSDSSGKVDWFERTASPPPPPIEKLRVSDGAVQTTIKTETETQSEQSKEDGGQGDSDVEIDEETQQADKTGDMDVSSD